MISNYADPAATRTVDLGPCRCPGRPHERDSATVLELAGYATRGAVREAARRQGDEAGHLTAILRMTTAWSLVLPDGKPRPIDATQVGLLDEHTVQAFLEVLDEAWADDPLPLGPSEPSPGGSSESDTPTPTTPSPTEESPSSTTT